MQLGRLLGARIRVHAAFLGLLALAILAGAAVETAILLSLLLSHEGAHLLMARGYDVEIEEVELLPFGGVARIQGLGGLEPGVEAMVALAGPLNNLMLLVVGILLAEVGWVGGSAYQVFHWGNVTLAGLNLLPALPLDGGRVVSAVLKRRLGERRARHWMYAVGRGVGLLLLVFGSVSLATDRAVPNLLVVGGFLWWKARGDESEAVYAEMRTLWRKREQLLERRLLPVENMVAPGDTPLLSLVQALRPNRYHLIWVVDDQMKILGMVDENRVLTYLMERGTGGSLHDLLSP